MRESVHCFKYLLGLSKPVTQTSAAEQACLKKHARGRRSLVEIGVFQAVNTRMLREAADPSGTIYAVDPFFRGRLGLSFNRIVARAHVSGAGGAAVRWVRDVSPHAASSQYIAPETTFDFIFIDGDHSYQAVALDWRTWVPRLQSGGIVALHDSRGSCGAGSEQFTQEVVLRDPDFELVEAVDSLTVLSRRRPS